MQLMQNACILDFDSLKPDDLVLSPLWELPFNWTQYGQTTPSSLKERLKEQQVILTNKVVLDAQVFQQFPEIQLVVVLATGTNNVDLQAARKAGVDVCNIEDYSTEAVAQHAFALILALKNNLIAYHHSVIDGTWSRSPFFCHLDYPMETLAGLTMAIIGFGNTGKRMKVLAEAFSMEVLVCESFHAKHKSGRVAFSSCLTQADIITLHVPLTQTTQNLINETAFSKMKSSAIIINVARGGLINEQALMKALDQRLIAGAALDVVSEEPPRKESTIINEKPNLIVTPHCAWGARQSRQNLIDKVVSILLRFTQGLSVKPVN